MYEVKHTKKH